MKTTQCSTREPAPAATPYEGTSSQNSEPVSRAVAHGVRSFGRLSVWSFLGIWVLGFGILPAAAQVPNAPQSAVQLPPPATAVPSIPVRTNSIIRPLTGAAGTTTGGAAGDSSPTTRTSPRVTTQPRTNSIVNPSPASTNIPGVGSFTVITPTATPEELLRAGLIDFR